MSEKCKNVKKIQMLFWGVGWEVWGKKKYVDKVERVESIGKLF